MEEYKCSTCKKTKERGQFHEWNHPQRPCFYICRECRSEDYYRKKYGTKCTYCEKYGRLNTNGICHKCNKKLGIRKCKECEQFLPMTLCFVGRNATCKNCLTEYRQD